MIRTVLNGRGFIDVGNVPCHADNEYITYASIKEDFYGNS